MTTEEREIYSYDVIKQAVPAVGRTGSGLAIDCSMLPGARVLTYPQRKTSQEVDRGPSLMAWVCTRAQGCKELCRRAGVDIYVGAIPFDLARGLSPDMEINYFRKHQNHSVSLEPYWLRGFPSKYRPYQSPNVRCIGRLLVARRARISGPVHCAIKRRSGIK